MISFDMEQRALSYDERIDRLIDGFVLQASPRQAASEIAERAAYSLAQTHRLFKRSYGESPGAFRRRLVLERAADYLVRSREPIWKIALESGFGSAEGFTRAFRRAFRTSPREFRRLGRPCASNGEPPLVNWLPAPSTVHYWRGSLLRSMDPGGKRMNIVQRLVEHDLSDTRRLLDRAQTLTAEQLDAPIADPQPRLFLECFDSTIRGRLNYLVLTKECWLAAVYAKPSPIAETAENDKATGSENGACPTIQGANRTPAGMLERFAAVERDWRELVLSVEKEGRWDEMFIDALCEQPVTFSFGGMIAHVLDQSARQRAELFRAFTALGHSDVCDGDPLSWEQNRAS